MYTLVKKFFSVFAQVQHPVHAFRPGTSSWQQAGESSPYDTSLSYYESARGTGGRGTPPPRDHGQPRLDDLFRQLQVMAQLLQRKFGSSPAPGCQI